MVITATYSDSRPCFLCSSAGRSMSMMLAMHCVFFDASIFRPCKRGAGLRLETTSRHPAYVFSSHEDSDRLRNLITVLLASTRFEALDVDTSRDSDILSMLSLDVRQTQSLLRPEDKKLWSPVHRTVAAGIFKTSPTSTGTGVIPRLPMIQAKLSKLHLPSPRPPSRPPRSVASLIFPGEIFSRISHLLGLVYCAKDLRC